jgi:hypothetical protein
MMVDPGTRSADILKLMGLPSTKSKFCGSFMFKGYLDFGKKAVLPETLPLSGGINGLTAQIQEFLKSLVSFLPHLSSSHFK